MYALKENADEKERDRIAEALKPPRTYKVDGAPAWYGSDEDAWAEFTKQS